MNIIEVEYVCKHCDETFYVYHDTDSRNDKCAWCGNSVRETGEIRTVEGDYIVTYFHDLEVARKLAFYAND